MGNSKIKYKHEHFKKYNKIFLIRIYDPRVDVNTINIEIIKTVHCFLSFCLICREINYIDYTKTFSNMSLIVVQTIDEIAFCDYYYCVYTTRFVRTVLFIAIDFDAFLIFLYTVPRISLFNWSRIELDNFSITPTNDAEKIDNLSFINSFNSVDQL